MVMAAAVMAAAPDKVGPGQGKRTDLDEHRANGTKLSQRAADKLEERAAAVMADAPVLAEPRRPTKEEQADKGVVNTVIRGSTNATYLAARLKRDNPEIAAAVSRGEFKSMRQAAIAAGRTGHPAGGTC
jgi:hypothetical protein